MKVHLASYQAISQLHGGPLVQLTQTMRELKKLGVDADLFDPWKRYEQSKDQIFHLFSANLGTFHLARIFNEFSLPFVTSSIFFTRHSSRYIRTAVALNNALKWSKTGIWTDYAFTQQICNWSRYVLPNTHDEAELLMNGLRIGRNKVSVVPNGVDIRFSELDPSLFTKKYGINDFILNVGHIGPVRKNVLNLIRALRTIDHPAVIIGKVTQGPYGEQCLKEARANKNILLIEGLDNDSELLASAYAACNVFVLPSLFETPGIAALEAGLAGAKVVITPFGGTKDYFSTYADYIDPQSINSIADAIRNALNRPPSDVLRNHIKSNFLWKHVAEQTLQAYEKVLDQ